MSRAMLLNVGGGGGGTMGAIRNPSASSAQGNPVVDETRLALGSRNGTMEVPVQQYDVQVTSQLSKDGLRKILPGSGKVGLRSPELGIFNNLACVRTQNDLNGVSLAGPMMNRTAEDSTVFSIGCKGEFSIHLTGSGNGRDCLPGNIITMVIFPGEQLDLFKRFYHSTVSNTPDSILPLVFAGDPGKELDIHKHIIRSILDRSVARQITPVVRDDTIAEKLATKFPHEASKVTDVRLESSVDDVKRDPKFGPIDAAAHARRRFYNRQHKKKHDIVHLMTDARASNLSAEAGGNVAIGGVDLDLSATALLPLTSQKKSKQNLVYNGPPGTHHYKAFMLFKSLMPGDVNQVDGSNRYFEKHLQDSDVQTAEIEYLTAVLAAMKVYIFRIGMAKQKSPHGSLVQCII